MAPSIVAAYGKLLEKHPLGILDSKLLPLPKPRMKSMLKLAYRRARTEGERRRIEQLYIGLSSFQSGIGDIPIDPDKPGSARHLQAAAHRSLMRQIAEESRALLEEFKAFKQNLVEQRR